MAEVRGGLGEEAKEVKSGLFEVAIVKTSGADGHESVGNLKMCKYQSRVMKTAMKAHTSTPIA
jgi:hypothetical protein